jgi:uncharacterized low-complexity protein
MRRLVGVTLAIASLAMFLPMAVAAQTQVTIGASTSGMVEFSGVGSAAGTFIGSCGEGNCIQGDAYLGVNAGTHQMWITDNNPLTSATPDPNIFAVNMKSGTLDFSFATGSGPIQGTTQLTVLRDGTNAPQFLDPLRLSRASDVFASLWKTGGIVPLNLTLPSPRGNALVQQVISGLAGSTAVTIAGGGFLTAPEPASIALIGSGLLALGGVLKRRPRR